MAPSLLGPPSLRQAPTSTQPETTQTKTSSGDPFIDLMVADFNNLAKAQPQPQHRPQMGFTENGSATFVTTGDPCLDLFFHVVPNTPSSYLQSQLPLAWAHNPLTTLKLVCNLRSVRGTGKSDKDGFYTAALWLHNHHPKTLACNLASLADFGYFKDLPEILYRLLEGGDVRKNQKSEWLIRKSGRGGNRIPTAPFRGFHGGVTKLGGGGGRRGNKNTTPKEVRVLNSMERAKSEKQKASDLRKKKYAEMAKKAVERYNRDPYYRFLFERVSDLFAECLKSDMESLMANKPNKISLAAKWCPSLDSSFDRATLLCESIARKVFPRGESYPEYDGVEDTHYAYRVRDRLRKDVLVPLRIVLELPEVYMGANLWGSIPYNRVASVAMKNYKDKFLKHDEERFKKYLEDVKAGKTTIAAGALLPHEIIASLNDGEGDKGEVAELQWKRVVEDLLKEGKMKNCLAVCDVSGSMDGTPMEVCVALGMLVAELNEEPWKGKVITFSANPQLHLIQGNDLKSKSEYVKQMEWGGNTNLQKVFDLILQVAVNGKLKAEQMIKRVFVFSDMEFDEASGYGGYYGPYGGRMERGWETDYEVIQRKYREKGYGDAVPQIVFWNLRDSKATPVPGTQPGVALLSGFSKNLLKVFLDNDGEIRPDATMQLAISGPEYQKLVVLD